MIKRIFNALILIIACITVFSSCTHLTSKNLAAKALTSCLPTCPSYDFREERIKSIEEDSYGRVLVAKEINPSISPFYSKDTVVVSVLQKYDKNNVYYYDDLFYVFLKNTSIAQIDLSAQEILNLKKSNDWDKALDDRKMSSRKISVSLDFVVERERYEKDNDNYKELRNDVKAFLKSEYAYTDEKGYSFSFCDFDGKSKELYFAEWEICENEYDLYFVLRNVHGSFDIMKIKDIYSYQQDLASFKKSNGWEY